MSSTSRIILDQYAGIDKQWHKTSINAKLNKKLQKADTKKISKSVFSIWQKELLKLKWKKYIEKMCEYQWEKTIEKWINEEGHQKNTNKIIKKKEKWRKKINKEW